MGAFTDVHLGKCGAAFFDHFLDLAYTLKDYCLYQGQILRRYFYLEEERGLLTMLIPRDVATGTDHQTFQAVHQLVGFLVGFHVGFLVRHPEEKSDTVPNNTQCLWLDEQEKK